MGASFVSIAGGRSRYDLAYYRVPIIWILKDTTGLLPAATHAYYNLEFGEEPTPAHAALMQVVRLGIFGDLAVSSSKV